VEEIKDDLGLRADDKSGMMNRLRTQNAFVSQIDLFGREDTSSGKKGTAANPLVPQPARKAFAHATQSAGMSNIFSAQEPVAVSYITLIGGEIVK
jgi:hypothetical protein